MTREEAYKESMLYGMARAYVLDGHIEGERAAELGWQKFKKSLIPVVDPEEVAQTVRVLGDGTASEVAK